MIFRKALSQPCSVRLKRFCTATIQDRTKLEQSLLLIGRGGYAFTQEELHRGACGLAAPILDENRIGVASLVITGVKFRLPHKKLSQFISMIREAAREISKKLKKVNAVEAVKSRRTGS